MWKFAIPITAEVETGQWEVTQGSGGIAPNPRVGWRAESGYTETKMGLRQLPTAVVVRYRRMDVRPWLCVVCLGVMLLRLAAQPIQPEGAAALGW